MSGRPHVMAMVIITRDSLTIKAFEQDGKNVAEELRRCGGDFDQVRGNFEDEPSLPDDLFDGLESIKCVAFEVMDTLNPI